MMRDFHTVASDEHSWYFHDEEPEEPQPHRQEATTISCDVHGVPTKISWNIRTHNSSSSYPSSSPVLFDGKPQPYARDSWTDTTTELIDEDDDDDDSGSYGTLDYSVDTSGEERRSTRMMQHHYLQQALYIHSSRRSETPAALLVSAIHPPPPQAPLTDYQQEELLLQQMYREELEQLDIHAPPQSSSHNEDHHRDTSCFGFRLFGQRLRDCFSHAAIVR